MSNFAKAAKAAAAANVNREVEHDGKKRGFGEAKAALIERLDAYCGRYAAPIVDIESITNRSGDDAYLVSVKVKPDNLAAREVKFYLSGSGYVAPENEGDRWFSTNLIEWLIKDVLENHVVDVEITRNGKNLAARVVPNDKLRNL